MEKRANQTLCGVTYQYTSGTMVGADVDIQLRTQQIVFASFLPWESVEELIGEDTDYITLENEPLDKAQWDAIEQAVTQLLPVLESAEKKENKLQKWWNEWRSKNIEVLDGGDIYRFSLTWRAQDGSEQTVDYKIPSDSRFYILVELMKETVDTKSAQ